MIRYIGSVRSEIWLLFINLKQRFWDSLYNVVTGMLALLAGIFSPFLHQNNFWRMILEVL